MWYPKAYNCLQCIPRFWCSNSSGGSRSNSSSGGSDGRCNSNSSNRSKSVQVGVLFSVLLESIHPKAICIQNARAARKNQSVCAWTNQGLILIFNISSTYIDSTWATASERASARAKESEHVYIFWSPRTFLRSEKSQQFDKQLNST